MEEPTSKYETGSVTLNRGLDLLEVLSDRRELRLVEAANAIGVSRPTAFRLLTALERRGYVEHLRARHTYRLGPAGARLATSFERSTLIQAALPIMAGLRDTTRETVNLALLRHNSLVYELIFDGLHALRMSAAVGEFVPAHATAIGKALLAALPSGRREALLGREPYRALTNRTLIERAALEADLEKTRTRGYAVDSQEAEIGAVCVACVICDTDGAPVGGLSISGLHSRIADLGTRRLGKMLIAECESIAHHLRAESSRVAEQR